MLSSINICGCGNACDIFQEKATSKIYHVKTGKNTITTSHFGGYLGL